MFQSLFLVNIQSFELGTAKIKVYNVAVLVSVKLLFFLVTRGYGLYDHLTSEEQEKLSLCYNCSCLHCCLIQRYISYWKRR
jgi:hypothetical protein